MKIETYKILISNLPVKQQCYTTKRTTWRKAEEESKWLKDLNNKLFEGKNTLTISRKDIFETLNSKEKIIKIIYWGYPAGMRGNHFINIFKNIDLIENILMELKKISYPTENDFQLLTKKLKEIRGLGLSTYSKILYFFEISFNKDCCLILDQRIINVFSNQTYSEFDKLKTIRYKNAEVNYLYFINLLNRLASTFNTKGENIELFLFSFGSNLKALD